MGRRPAGRRSTGRGRPTPAATLLSAKPRALSRRLSDLPRSRWEPWRDWAVIALINHALLLSVALLHPRGLLLVAAAIPVSIGLTIGTLTVLHDAGHRMFSARAWPNVLAVQTSTPAGLWVSHWTLKHRVHHKFSQVYPLDESTRSSSLVRLHPAAPSKRWQRGQHIYAWPLYGLAWLGELRSQLRYLRTGDVPGAETPPRPARAASFVLEKGLCLLVLLPYAWLLGVGSLAILLAVAETVGSLIAAVILLVGHVSDQLAPSTETCGASWGVNLVRTTASFSTESTMTRWLTGGLTHHLAHHLRPVAVRSELPRVHRTTVRELAATTGIAVVEYATLRQAAAAHWRRLRALGQPDLVPLRAVTAGGSPGRADEFAG